LPTSAHCTTACCGSVRNQSDDAGRSLKESRDTRKTEVVTVGLSPVWDGTCVPTRLHEPE
jgi:hypothetical protein